MNCTNCQDTFTAVLEKEAPRDMTSAFTAHLASCSACASEFSRFKKTVQALQNLPQQHVPADFLIGINTKLDTNSLSRLKAWFAFMGQHKLTASATMATLIVGVISATVLQTTPYIGQTQISGGEATYSQAITTQSETKNSENNYYPGVPYLIGKQAPQKITRPVVQFASTNPKTSSDYYGIQNPRGSPQTSITHPYTSFSTIGVAASTTPKPDFHIIIHPTSGAQQQAITRQISSHANWKSHVHKSTLFVTLANRQLPEFQALFPPSRPPHKKLDLTPLSQKTEQDLFTIAISFK